MKRREFIASTGAAAGVFGNATIGNAAPTSLSAAKLQKIEIAVKGSFGAGFSLRSAEHSNGRVTAVIEHNKNYMTVASSDLSDWSILRASEM